jgi:transcriptional regulator with XRE-family HTH domain
MSYYLDLHSFAASIRSKRGGQSLREAAAQMDDMSASTLLRLERGQMPDIVTLLDVCDWLSVSPCTFIKNDEDEDGQGGK